MKLKVKRIDKKLPLPTYKKGASCFDFYCRKGVVVPAHKVALVLVNTIVELPSGYTLLIFARSSTPLLTGLLMANSVGIVDPFYCGEKDEIIIELYNPTSKSIRVRRGDRLAQGLVVKHEIVKWQEVEKMGEKGEGGYWKIRS